MTSKVVDTPAIAKGQKYTLNIAGLPKAAADYLKATANTPSGFTEKDATNNMKLSAEFSSNKSCTPQ